MDNVSVILESLVHVCEEIVETLHIFLKMLFHTLSLPFPLLPNFQFSLKVNKALLYLFDVEQASHTFLSQAERLKLGL